MSEAPQNGADILTRIKPQRRREVVRLCLRPDLLDEWDRLHRELAEAQIGGGVDPDIDDTDAVAAKKDSPTGTRLAGGAKQKRRAREIAQQIVDLEPQIAAAEVSFWMEALPSDEWNALCALHPPREENPIDMMAGHNTAAVLDAAVRECLIDPVFTDCTKKSCSHDDCGSWQALVRLLNVSEWNELRNVCQSVNGAAVNVNPKSELASRVLAPRGSGSKRRASGE